jgi:predicted acylesterase/phospholipase RssA
MGHRNAAARTRELKKYAENIYGAAKFETFKIDIGIVSTNTSEETAIIFKSSDQQAMGRQGSFVPGFGCSIVDALMASTAAYPLFEKQTLQTDHHGEIELMDGGYVANNPTLFAIADALKAPNVTRNSIDILSVGVGQYIEPKKDLYSRIIFSIPSVKLVQTQLATSTNTIENMRKIFFDDVACVRVNDRYTDKQYATDLLETSVKKLNTMFALGRKSYGLQQSKIKSVFNS